MTGREERKIIVGPAMWEFILESFKDGPAFGRSIVAESGVSFERLAVGNPKQVADALQSMDGDEIVHVFRRACEGGEDR